MYGVQTSAWPPHISRAPPPQPPPHTHFSTSAWPLLPSPLPPHTSQYQPGRTLYQLAWHTHTHTQTALSPPPPPGWFRGANLALPTPGQSASQPASQPCPHCPCPHVGWRGTMRLFLQPASMTSPPTPLSSRVGRTAHSRWATIRRHHLLARHLTSM